MEIRWCKQATLNSLMMRLFQLSISALIQRFLSLLHLYPSFFFFFFEDLNPTFAFLKNFIQDSVNWLIGNAAF